MPEHRPRGAFFGVSALLFAAAASFVGMWAVMMVAMMLPSLPPNVLHRQVSASRTPSEPSQSGQACS